MGEAALIDRQILRAKLYVPRRRPDAVPRTRLHEKLDEGAKRELTVVSAPAGSGKTTLLAEWSEHCGLPVAWISLDGRDDDPVRFLAYVISAIRTIHDGFGETTRAFLDSLHSRDELEPVLTALSNDILEVPQDFILVLDDYHTIRSRTIHDALAFLLDYWPPPMHLVVAGRTNPPLPLSRLRARNRLVELRAADLRFTLEEAAGFLRSTMGLDVTEEVVATLEERTEGWVAGLQLAAHSLRAGDGRAFEALPGGVRHVFDYLADEVLSRQPEDVRDFLLKTSIVETLNGSLCDALTGADNGRDMLERLERNNLFLVPLDAQGRYYRYHHLFATFLRERLERRGPEAARELHRRAGRWQENDGCLTGAVEHSLAAGDYERAADLIEAEGGARRGFVDASLLVRWLGMLPDRLMRGRPHLCVLHAWVLVHSGDLDAAERRLRETERVLGVGDEPAVAERPVEGRTMLGEMFIIRARIAAIRENARLTMELSNKALELLPQDELHLRGEVALDLGYAYCAIGDFASAGQSFAEAVATGQSADSLRIALFALRYLASLEISAGRLHEAERLLSEGRELADRWANEMPAIAGTIDIGMGQLLSERGELDEAREHLERGIEFGRRSGEVKILVYGYVSLAQIELVRGNVDAALSLTRKAGQLTPRWPLIWAWRARVQLARGDVESAARWAREYAATEDYMTFPRLVERITMDRVLLAQGKIYEASEDIARVLEIVESDGRVAYVIESLILLAFASERQGAKTEALTYLDRALSLAEPAGFVRVFLDEGRPMAALLERSIREARYVESGAVSLNGALRDFAGNLLQHFALEAARHENLENGRSPGRTPGLEPLSEREIEVLELVAAGRSNTEIAGELYLSVGTVKAHVHHIFGKLLVRNRSQAVARARELRLLA